MLPSRFLGLLLTAFFVTIVACSPGTDQADGGDAGVDDSGPPRDGGDGDADADIGDGDVSVGDADFESGDGDSSECDDLRPCPEPLVCREGRCEPECVGSSDCPDGRLCRDQVCQDPECGEHLDCASLDQSCIAGECRTDPCGVHTFVFDPGERALDSVVVAGSFNGWSTSTHAFEFLEDRRVWWRKVDLGEGHHEYKLVLNGGEWIADPANPDTVGHDGNSLLELSCPESCAPADIEAFDWRDTVMYFAMVDRFRDLDGAGSMPDSDGSAENPRFGWGGGDLAGVDERLPYLTDLGVTLLWLSAPYRNGPGGYHGYAPAPEDIDYSDLAAPSPRPLVDPRFGGDDELRDLIDAAHGADAVGGHGVRVMFDYVMNHVHESCALARAHPEWFYFEDGAVRECNNGTPDIPEDDLWEDDFYRTRCAFGGNVPPFDYETSAAAREWSFADALWWAREYGLDGYRLDAIKHVPDIWLTGLRERLNREFPSPFGDRYLLIGETYDHNRDVLRRYVDPATRLDGQFDFPFQANLCDAVLKRSTSLADFDRWLADNEAFYSSSAIMSTWIGNHDLPRVIHSATGEITRCGEGSNEDNNQPFMFASPENAEPYERLSVAFAVMMTSRGIPLIYYGDEIGLAGGGDPENRRMMPWDDAALNAHQIELRRRVRALTRARGANRALSRGHRTTHSASADTWVYTMSAGCGAAMPDVTVAINRSDWEQTVTIPSGSYDDLMNEGTREGGETTLPARSFLLLRSR